jgi:hypothetical protein
MVKRKFKQKASISLNDNLSFDRLKESRYRDPIFLSFFKRFLLAFTGMSSFKLTYLRLI